MKPSDLMLLANCTQGISKESAKAKEGTRNSSMVFDNKCP
jgi:hypothetical protein